VSFIFPTQDEFSDISRTDVCLHVNCLLFRRILVNLVPGRHISVRGASIKFHEHPSGWCRLVPSRQAYILYIHTYTHTHTHTHTYINNAHIHIHTYIHTYIYTYIHIYTYTYKHTYIYTYKHTYIHTVYTHTHTHTHIHIWTQTDATKLIRFSKLFCKRVEKRKDVTSQVF
jgi:hypothetical protein